MVWRAQVSANHLRRSGDQDGVGGPKYNRIVSSCLNLRYTDRNFDVPDPPDIIHHAPIKKVS
eukprot:2695920-Prymnesium_polylepis.1